MKKTMSCEVEYMFEFEYFFNKIANDPRIDNLVVKKIVRQEDCDDVVYYVVFEFDILNFNDYELIQSIIMDNASCENRISFSL